ncbi:type II toxin-antitoxin system VapC family toxin [Ornithinimicrobium sp. F0845]|uniref:type II toxin-antitoxin system VapC family toxin n=1 Tax=Ornithinimicrobium sp. F0845 TaxID=2926412 RepID=UPI001FF434E8|nr:type II toxin-antitoxin system VapC family toxin [Ornithinimicrobium sp. F0845]
MRGVVLDTNVFLWLLTGDERLGQRSRLLVTGSSPVYASSVCVLEVTIKEMFGRLRVPEPVTEAAQAAGLVELPFRAPHAAALAEFPELARQDPFDRMLLAQASSEGLALLTSDQALLGLGLEWVVDARE